LTVDSELSTVNCLLEFTIPMLTDLILLYLLVDYKSCNLVFMTRVFRLIIVSSRSRLRLPHNNKIESTVNTQPLSFSTRPSTVNNQQSTITDGVTGIDMTPIFEFICCGICGIIL